MVAIIGMLVAMLLPAVQAARESARRMYCQNNVKQLVLAFSSFDSQHGEFPPSRKRQPAYTGWGQYVLPYIEQESVLVQYNFNLHWFDPANRGVITAEIKTFYCPSSPRDGFHSGTKTDKELGITYSWESAVTDYSPAGAIKEELINLGLIAPVEDVRGAMTKMLAANKASEPADKSTVPYVRNRIADIADGTSNTILFVEMAGQPRLWLANHSQGATQTSHAAGWADFGNVVDPEGSTYDGLVKNGPCAFNCTNQKNVYAFHPGGANLGFADGSVRFVHEDISMRTFGALVTRAGGEIPRTE